MPQVRLANSLKQYGFFTGNLAGSFVVPPSDTLSHQEQERIAVENATKEAQRAEVKAKKSVERKNHNNINDNDGGDGVNDGEWSNLLAVSSFRDFCLREETL